MKCPTCGADLQIEDEKCPFCGNPNPFAVKHQQDMRFYHQEFQRTRQEVEQKTRHFTAFTAKITVIAVLAVLVIIMAVMAGSGPHMIWRSRVRKDIQKNMQAYEEQLKAYEQAGEWLELYNFYDARNLSYGDAFREYRVIYYTVFDYKYILNCVLNYSEDETYYNAESIAPRIAGYLDDFYQSVERTSYDSAYYDDSYTPQHQEALEQLRSDLEAVLITYCHLTEEEVSILPDYSTVKKGNLIKEGLLREDSNDEE